MGPSPAFDCGSTGSGDSLVGSGDLCSYHMRRGTLNAPGLSSSDKSIKACVVSVDEPLCFRSVFVFESAEGDS